MPSAVLLRASLAGARAFRINFSHGTLDDHQQVLANIRSAVEETGVAVAVVGDRLGQRNLSNLVYIHQVGSL